MGDIKGDKIGEFNHVLKRQEREGNVNDVNQQIRTSDVDLSSNKRILVELRVMNSTDETTTTQFSARTYSSRTGFTLPREVIRELSLQPGHSVQFVLFERTYKENNPRPVISDDGDVIDRVSAGDGGSGTVDSRLFSESSRKYINKHGGEARLTFKNIRTGKKSTDMSHTNYSDQNPVYFSKLAREETDTEIGDWIEIKPAKQDDRISANPSTEKKIDEIHTMLSDLCEVMLPSQE